MRCLLTHPFARLNGEGNHEREGDGNGRGQKEEAEGLAADPAHGRSVGEVTGTADQGNEHQRHNEEL